MVLLASLKGEKYTKIIFHPANDVIRESWLDRLALACDSDESDDEYEVEQKARPDDVASSAKEFDAREIIIVDGQDDVEREVCEHACHLYHPNDFDALGAIWTGGRAYHNLWHCCNGRERQSHHS